MDAAVLDALARWPDVPAVHGWLSLDARGRWRLRGETIGNDAIRAYIDRNYASDASGCWYFQNGPQRVYVALDLAPWIWRLDAAGGLVGHTGATPRQLCSAWIDGDGRLFLVTDLGPGALDDRDLAAMAARLVDRAGMAPSDDALARWCDVDLDAGPLGAGVDTVLLRTEGLAEASGAPLPVQRLAGDAGTTLGFVARPGA